MIVEYLEITSDENDGDYNTERAEITSEQLGRIRPLIAAIKDCKEDHNWPLQDWDEDEIRKMYSEFDKDKIDDQSTLDYFIDLVPYGPYGCHTIVNIQMIKIEYGKSLL